MIYKKHILSIPSKTSWLKPPLSSNIKSGYVVLHKGEEIGEHITNNKEEVIYIIEGQAWVIIEGEQDYAEAGDAIFIPANIKHNIKNENEKILKYLYVVSLFNCSPNSPSFTNLV